jgi:plasmid stabilization system protein ParE
VTLQIYIRPEAEADLDNAAAWYQTQVTGLGYEFLDEIKKALQIMADNPEIFQIVYKNIHRAIIQRFPFVIYYQIEEETIVVLGIIHASRNPHDWKKRLN